MTDWTFEGFGSRFDAHAEAHLPHYATAHELIARSARYVLPPGGIVADLGCSTGTSAAALSRATNSRRFVWHGYDSDRTMLDEARETLDHLTNVDGQTHLTDLRARHQLSHENASVTLALWTLQFLPADSWVELLAGARERSNRDGVLLVAAKTRLPSSRWQEIADGALFEWKAEHGVGATEILDKSRSLRGTMLVVPADRLVESIEAAGWVDATILFRWHAWMVVGAFTAE